MTKNFLFLITSFLLFLKIFPLNAADVKYSTYINKSYNYEIIVPKSWQKDESVKEDKHSMYSKINASTGIKVRAFKSSNDDIEKIIHAETWDLKKIDPRLNKILETEQIKIQKNITGKLLLFDYRTKSSSLLQRTLIAVNGGIVYIVECKSPISTFYKYEDIFTTAIASFKYLDGAAVRKSAEKSEPIDDLEEDSLEDTLKEEAVQEDEQL